MQNADAMGRLDECRIFRRAGATLVATQRADECSLLNTHSKLLHLRKGMACLRRGSLELLPDGALPADVVGYDRVMKGEKVRVLLNFSRLVQVVELDCEPDQALVRSDDACSLNGKQVSLSPRGGILLGSQ